MSHPHCVSMRCNRKLIGIRDLPQTFTQARDSHNRDVSVEPSSPAGFQESHQATPARETESTNNSTSAARPTLQSQPSNTFVPAPAISSLVQHIPASSPALHANGSEEDPLAAAQKEIERLKQQLSSSSSDPQATGLRKRTTGAGAGEKADKVAQQTESAVMQIVHTGVSLPAVLAISFAVFVVTYLFL